jgi:hypothetical protein
MKKYEGLGIHTGIAARIPANDELDPAAGTRSSEISLNVLVGTAAL